MIRIGSERKDVKKSCHIYGVIIMIFSPHTFELTLDIDSEKFHKIKDKAYKKSKGNHRMYKDNKKADVYIDTALKEKGITKIEYHDNLYKKKIIFIINPSRVLGGDDIIQLWQPKENNIKELISKLDKYIDDYFNNKFSLNDFRLSRIDFTVNIDVGDRENVSAYLKILRNIGKVKGFAPKYDKNDDKIDHDLSFDLDGISNGVEFTAYDKEAESKRKEAKGILRVEVRLIKPKGIRRYTDETVIAKQIKYLSANSQEIFLSIFKHIVPFGDFYKKKEAVTIIEHNVVKKKSKEKMLQLLNLIPKKKSLLLAQKEMNERKIETIMDMFAKLNVSPVTISKRQEIKHLKNLYDFFV
jgi:hypothetical protein